MEKEVIEITAAKISLEKDGILRIKMKDGADIELDDVKEIIETHLKLSKGKKVPVLTDARKVKAISREARQSSAEESSKISLANAVLVNSPLSRTLGRLYLGINKPSYPTKLFTSEDKAIKWLNGFNKKTNDEGKK